MHLARNPWGLLVFFGLVVLATRLPFAPGQLFTFDDVNLAYSIGHYDIRISQPHPPGYPLFVLEMRVLSWLRFKRPESILLVLALGGSLAALLLAVHFGNLFFGGDSGFWGALVLAVSPPFWHSGITSALRVQLAIISLAVAAACWRAWTGDPRWVRRSAIMLALGAGIRPETGVLLFPLWAVSAFRAPVDWAERRRSLLWMAGTVAVWLLPAMIASGGPVNFVRANLDYISDQAGVSSGLFGARENIWLRTFYRLSVWVFSPIVALGLPMALAWRSGQGWDIGWNRLAFLALWLLPAFGFALNVHVEDPGQTLIMGVVVAAVGGYWIERAIEECGLWVSRLLVLIVPAGALIVNSYWTTMEQIWWCAGTALVAGLAIKLYRTPNLGYFPRWQAVVLVVVPVIYIQASYFLHRGWYYRGPARDGIQGAAEKAWADVNSGFALTSLEQIQSTLAVDDHTLRETRRLAAGHTDKTVVVWERGLTAWRKIGYYAPELPVFVLEHKKLRDGTPPVMALWRGAQVVRRLQGGTRVVVNLPRGARIIWVLNPETKFHELVKENFAVTEAGPVLYTELPDDPGARTLGEYEIAW